MKRTTTLLTTLLILLASCNKDNTIEVDTPLKPVIELDSETGIYTIKTGRTLTIRPTIHNATDAMYSWVADGKLVGTDPTFTGSWNEPAEVYITFRVENEVGAAEEEIRVDVLDLAPPVISLVLPSQGLKVLPSTDYIFAPDIQNDDLEAFAIRWMLDGTEVSTEKTYTFNRAELGNYTLTVTATNIDGTDTREIPIEVVDELPYRVSFESFSYFNETTDRHTFADRPVYLRPILEYFDNPAFVWAVDGIEVDEAHERLFRFTPTAPGTYVIAVTVTEKGNTDQRISRNLTRAATALTTEVRVHCTAETQDDVYRPSTPASSATWNKVFEYVPAPGQFINEQKTGGFDGTQTTHQAALAYAETRLKQNMWVSLGGFGGYMVVGFDHSIPRSGTEYDFTVHGNAFDGSSEPGIVWVMQDVNRNGLPDDEWYELRGSETGKPETLHHYEITYYRPAGKGMDVQWTDSRGKSGTIDYLPQFHNQDYYYPAWIKDDSYTLRGTLLESRNVQDPVTGNWNNQTYDWGYADNFGSDNLGGDPVNGSGQQNRFKIANAIHPDGSPVDLQFIDFVKVQVAVNTKSGWLGEASTEVCSFTDLSISTN